MTEDSEALARRKRIDRLKKIIVGTIIAAIVIPLITAIVFGALYFHTRKQLGNLQTDYDNLLKSMEQLKDDIEYEAPSSDVYSKAEVEVSSRDGVDQNDSSDEATNSETSETTDEIVRHVYLTFDDGPSSNTEHILDVLAQYDVKATFFVTGKTDETSVAAYKRIVEDGHTLGMHSYSHKYSQIYSSEDSFAEDLDMLQEYLYEVTGVWSRYYRFPGGSSNTASRTNMDDLIRYLDEHDIEYYDWNIVSGDATGKAISADGIYNNCVNGIEQYTDVYILMHDAASKNSTVEALPRIIETIQSMDGTEIIAIDDDAIPIHHRVIE